MALQTKEILCLCGIAIVENILIEVNKSLGYTSTSVLPKMTKHNVASFNINKEVVVVNNNYLTSGVDIKVTLTPFIKLK